MNSRIKVSVRTIEPNLALTTAFSVVCELLRVIDNDFSKLAKHNFITLDDKHYVITKRDKNLNTRFDVSTGHKC